MMFVACPVCEALATDWTLCPGISDPVAEGSTAPRYEAFFSPYTHHWSHDPEHRPVFAASRQSTLSRSISRTSSFLPRAMTVPGVGPATTATTSLPWSDGVNADKLGTDYRRTVRGVTAGEPLALELAPGGGAVVRLRRR